MASHQAQGDSPVTETARRPLPLVLGVGLLVWVVVVVAFYCYVWATDYVLLLLAAADILRDVGAVVVLLLAFFAVGHRFLGLMGDDSKEPLMTTALGMAIFLLATAVIGLVGLLHGSLLVGLVAAGLLSNLRAVGALLLGAYRAVITDRGAVSARAILSAALIGALLLLVFIQALGPSSGPDDLIYHVSNPVRQLQSHHLAITPETKGLHAMQYNQMLYALCLAVSASEGSPGVMNFALLLMLLGTVRRFCRRFFPAVPSTTVMLLILSQPIVVYVSVRPYSDLLPTWLIMLGLHHAVVGTRDASLRRLLYAAVFFGVALGTKLTVIASIVPLVVVVTLAMTLLRRPPVETVTRILLCGGVVLLSVLPWHVWMWINFGNLVDPIFTSGYWNNTPDYIHYPSFQDGIFSRLRHEVTLENMVLLPFSTTFSRVPPNGSWGNIVTPVYLCLLPLVLLVCKGRRLRTFLGLYVGVYLLLWATNFSFIRYLLPVLPLVSVLVVDALWDVRKRMPARSGAMVSMAVVALLVLLPSASMVYKLALEPQTHKSLLFRTGLISRGDFYRSTRAQYYTLYKMFEHCNRTLDPGKARIRIFWDARSQHLRVPHIPDITSHSDLYELLQKSGWDQARFHRALRSRRITHILYNAGAYNQLFEKPGAIFGRDPTVRRKALRSNVSFGAYAGRYLRLVHREGPILLFELKSP